MNIEKIKINNFRIFNGTYEFDFTNKKMIIISGPNGNGKSTVFDAIQWCLTDEIPRYKGSSENLSFNFLMNDIAFKNPDIRSFSVEIIFRASNDEVHTLKREQLKKKNTFEQHPSTVTINGTKYKKKAAKDHIRKLISSNEISIEETNEINLSNFFASTQLLSQDSLENFIRFDKPQDRFKLLDQVLGIKKYSNDFSIYLDTIKEIAVVKKDSLVENLNTLETQSRYFSLQISEIEKSISDVGDISEKAILNRIQNIIKDDLKKEFMKLNDQTKLNEITFELIDLLKDEKEHLENKYKKIEDKLQFFYDSKQLISVNPEEYILEQKNINNNIKNFNRKIQSRENGKITAQKKLVQYEQLKIRRNEYQNLKMNLEKTRIEINDKNEQLLNISKKPYITSIEKEYSNWELFIEKFEFNRKELNNLKIILKNKEINKNIKIYTSENKEILSEIVSNNQSISELQKQVDYFNKQINELNEVIDEQKESITLQLIRQVQNHLTTLDVESKCVVCGHDYLENNILKSKVLEEITKTNKSLSKIENTKIEWVSKSNMMKEYIRLKKNKVQELQQKLERTEKNIIDLKNGLNELLISHPLTELKIYELTDIINMKEIFIHQNEEAYQTIQKIIPLKKEINHLNDNLKQFEKTINLIFSETGSYKKYLDLDEISLVEEIQKYNLYTLKSEENLIEIKKLLESEALRLQKNKNIINERQLLVLKIKSEFSNFSGSLSDFRSLVSTTTAHKEYIQSTIISLNKVIYSIKDFNQNNRLMELRKQFIPISEQITKVNNEVKVLEKFIKNDISFLNDQHSKVRDDLINSFLTQHSDFIDQIFLQINPHAIYRHVHIVPKNNKVYILLTKKGKSMREIDLRKLDDSELKREFNASLKFSSGQANVLAVCIFLALNRSQKWTNLSFVGIDDPFQNLDDINVFSFLDVLNQIISLQNKQLFVSTHNKNFEQLLKIKMDLNSEEIGTINFNSYGESGISVSGNCIQTHIDLY